MRRSAWLLLLFCVLLAGSPGCDIYSVQYCGEEVLCDLPELRSDQGICVCRVGSKGCACTAGDGCDTELICKNQHCEAEPQAEDGAGSCSTGFHDGGDGTCVATDSCSEDYILIAEGNCFLTFTLIPAGTFTMGSPDGTGAEPAELGRITDEHQHQVTLARDFYMQTTETTQPHLMGNNPPGSALTAPSWIAALAARWTR